MRYEVEVGGRLHQIQVDGANGRFLVTLGARAIAIDAVRVAPQAMSLLIEDADRTASHEVVVVPGALGGQFSVRIGAAFIPVVVNGRHRRDRLTARVPSGTEPERIVAPMPGKIVRLLVQPGDRVSARQPIVVIEAMKMENELRASRDGVAVDVSVQPGQSVEAGALLVLIAAGQVS
jgi:biotin carboxyl carrier protein